jgi:glucosylceramidase
MKLSTPLPDRAELSASFCFLHVAEAWTAALLLTVLPLCKSVRAGFTDVTAASGLAHVQGMQAGLQVMSGGAAAGDFDGDGRVDLFFTRSDASPVLYRNSGSGFVDSSAAAGFAGAPAANGVGVGDVDDDGDLDLYVTGRDGSSRHYLYVNDGAGVFSEQALLRGADVTAPLGVTRKGMGVAFGDYDRDGYLDILTSDHSRPTATSGSRLLHNMGQANPGHFEDVTHAAGLDVYRTPLCCNGNSFRFQPMFSDVDRDGRTDVLFSSDSHTSQIFWNNGDGTFSDGTVPAGVGTDKSGMGSALGDYDNDGDLDWFVSAIMDTQVLSTNPGNRLYRNEGDRTFTDVTTAAGVRDLGWGWGAEFFDFDNDGRLDLMATNGFPAMFPADPTTLWRNQGDGTFGDVSAANGVLDTGQGRGLLTLDYDSDGDLDAVVVNNAAAPILYRNDADGSNHWLRVKAKGTVSNRDGVGAVVTLVPDAANPQALQMREISAGGGYLAQSEMTAQFGLGADGSAVDRVIVRWPSGVVQTIVDVAANQLLTVVEPMPGDFDGDLVVDDQDLAVWRSAQGSAPGGADVNGDGVADGADLLFWQRYLGHAASSNAVGQAVPEPATAILGSLALGALGALKARRRSPRISIRRSSLQTAFALAAFATALASSAPVRAVDVWVTTGSKSDLLEQKTDVLFQSGTGSGGTAVTVAPSTTYQTMSGFGAALTDSSAWLLQNRMSAAQRDKLMRQLFSPESGIGVNYLRVPMGASDFTASGFYTYNDNPPGGTDAAQQNFSIAHDEAYIIPQLQQAKTLNSDLKLMATPWSAPAWMKTNGSLVGGGSLATQWYGSYAVYLSKMLQAYEAQGLPFDTFSIQNEPQHAPGDYPGMLMTATQQTNFIKNSLGPQLAADGVTVKLLAYDHNWDTPSYPDQVLDDPVARQYVAGSAFHAYAGSVSAQTTVHNAHPDKDIYFTEITGGSWATNFGDNLVWNFENIIIGTTRNWSKNALLWNLALDQTAGPHQGGCTNCRGVVTVNSGTGAVTFNEEFYSLGQATKVVQSGAVRVASTADSNINSVAFVNPDGSHALIALNPNSTSKTFRVVENGQYFSYTLPAKSVASFLWDAQGADFDNGGFDDGGFQTGGGSLDAWTLFGAAGGNVIVSSEAVLAGDKSLKLFGQFNGVDNASGVFQGISVAAGDQVRADLSVLVRSTDGIAGSGNVAAAKIEFYDQYGAARSSASFLGEAATGLADGSTSLNSWLARGLSALAPAGAVEARLVLQFQQTANQPGAVFLDSVSFGIQAPGDFNGDGSVDENDLSLWRSTYGSMQDLAADGNGDGQVDGADLLIWQQYAPSPATTELTATVPEPRFATMALASGVTIAAARRAGLRPDRAAKAPRANEVLESEQ